MVRGLTTRVFVTMRRVKLPVERTKQRGTITTYSKIIIRTKEPSSCHPSPEGEGLTEGGGPDLGWGM